MMRGNKYRAVKTVVDGIRFDSKAEAKRYGELKLLEKAGEIWALAVHPTFTLAVNDEFIANYRPDFSYKEKISGRWHVEDVKSPPTARKRDFILIRKLMRAIHGIDIDLIGVRSPANTRQRAA